MKEEFKEEYSGMESEQPSRETDRDGSVQDAVMNDSNRGSEDKRPRTRPRRTKNKLFQDVEATGRWGAIASTDKIIVGVVFLVIVAAVVTTVVLVTKKPGVTSRPVQTPAPTPSPTIPPDVSPELQFPVIIHELDNHTLVNSSLVSRDIVYYQTPDNRANGYVLEYYR
jgi:hypothetical protein